MATASLLSSDRCRYGEIILSLKNDYTKQKKNYPKTFTDMYVLRVAFNTTRTTLVSGGSNKGLNLGNVAVESETTGDRGHGSGGGIGRKLECWRCGGEHMKRDCLKHAEEKENKQKDGEGVKNKRVEVTGRQLHAMFTSSADVLSGTDFSELGEDDEFT